MDIGKRYQLTKRVKIHTKPTVRADIILVGTFKYDTDSWYCFNEFKCNRNKGDVI